MTLSDMVDFICGKVNQTEAEDKAACKSFLTQQHETLWHSQLWKDSLVSFTQTLSPAAADYLPSSTYLPGKGVLLLPPIIERVLAVRTDSRKLNIRRPEFYYRVDYDAFSKTGNAAEYLVLPGCVWEFDSAQSFALVCVAADAAMVVTADLLDADGISVNRSALTLGNSFATLGPTERIDALQKKASSGPLTLLPDYIVLTNSASQIPTDFRWGPTADAEVAGPGTVLQPGESVVMKREDAFLLAYEVGFAGIADDSVLIPTVFYGTVLFGSFNNSPSQFSTSGLPAPVMLAAADTAGKIRQRVRLVEILGPSPTTVTIRVLGKRGVPSFSDDLDQPAINGFVQPLLALGQAEMLERERQYGKAQAKKQEGITLLQELMAVETVQQSHQTQIVPECGYGDEVFGGGHPWGFTF